MPRPSLLALSIAALAIAPLHAQQTPPSANVAKPDAPITTVTLPELTELGKARSGMELKRLVEMAQIRIDEVKDPEERALTQGTLDAIVADPSLAMKILAAHTVRLAEVRDKAPDIIFLLGLKDCKTDAEVVRYAREMSDSSSRIGDPVLGLTVRLTLAKLKDKPADKDAIYRDHMKKVAVRFLEAARVSYEANNPRSAFNSIQIAIRCDPSNLKAHYLFSLLLQKSLGDVDKAVQTLRVGLDYLTPSSPEALDYLHRYFQLLESREHDAEVVSQAATLLAKDGFEASCREMMAMHLATCLYYTGRCDDALRIISIHKLDSRVQGLLLKAKALFDSRRTEGGASALEDKLSNFQGTERDAILYQLQRFWSSLGKDEMALTVADQRVREFPTNPSPRVHRLWLYNRMGDAKRFDAGVTDVFNTFGTNQGAMLGVANLASQRGLPDLAGECVRRATTLSFNRPLFALLRLESLINAKQYQQALGDYTTFLAMDKTLFKGDEGTVHALIAAGKTGVGDPVSKSEAERHVKAFIDTKGLQPIAYVSAGRLLRKAGDLSAARRILEAGRVEHPWNNQIRADLTTVRILAGLTDDAHGSRPTVADEVLAIAAGRRVSPKFWETVGFWIHTETGIPGDKLAQLNKVLSENSRPDLVREDADN